MAFIQNFRTPAGIMGLRRMLRRGRIGRVAKPILPNYTARDAFAAHRRIILTALVFFAVFYGFAFGLYTTYIAVPLAVPVGLLALLVVWKLPETGHAPLGALEWWFFAFFFALMLWPNYLALALPGMPWITALRLTGFPLALVLMIALSTSQQLRADIARILETEPLIWKGIVAFAMIGTVTIAFSKEPFTSLNRHVINQIYWTMIFFLSVFMFSRPGRATKFVMIFMACAVVVSFIVMREVQLRQVPWANSIPSFLKVDDEYTAARLRGGTRAATDEYRAVGVQTTALSMAEFFALCCPFLLHAIFAAVTRNGRIIAAIAFGIVVYGIILTGSRLGMIGLLSTLLFYSLTVVARFWQANKNSILGPMAILAYPFFFIALLGLTFVSRRLEMMVWGYGATQASTEARKAQVAVGIPRILKEPWGNGPGQAGNALGWTNSVGTGSIDNYYLSVALEYGVLGFLIYYGMFYYAIVKSGKTYLLAKSKETMLLLPVTIALLNYVIVKLVLSQEANHPLAFALLGMAVALMYRVRTQDVMKNADVAAAARG